MTELTQFSKSIDIATGKTTLRADVAIPVNPLATVVVVSGPAGESVAQRRLSAELNRNSVATVSVNLLADDEQQIDSRTGHFRYDADFLAHRLLDVGQWITTNPDLQPLPVGYAGHALGAAAALVAAALRPDAVGAVVSINGRTDLASDYLRSVKTPTLLVLNDMPVLRMNRDAIAQIRGEKRIEIIHAEGETAIELFVEKSLRWFADKLNVLTPDAWGIA